MTLTTIHCTTCTSTVPWGPHCPECGAYLEFAGDPPWRPEPPGLVREETTDPGELEPVVETVTETITVSEATLQREPVVPTPLPAPRASYLSTVAVLVAGAVVTPIIWWAVGPVIGGMSGLVFLVWAAVLWPRREMTEAPAVLPPAAEQTVVVAQVVAQETVVEEQPEVQARAPQALPRRAVESTRTLVLSEPEGSVPCSVCARLNVAGRHYCAWCGAVLPEISIAPATTAYEPTPALTAAGRSERQQRRLSRSWRTPILVLSLLGVLMASIVFALFGPNAFQVRFGMTTVYQLINQFIDPYAGEQADITEVVATSTTRGTSPRDILGPDAATFWVSAPSQTQGAGEELAFWFDGAYTINRMVILPGIQNGLFDPRAVATPRDITLTFDDGTTAQARLDLIQSVGDLQQLVRFPKVTTETVQLRIDSVYPPHTPSIDMVSEVAISGVRFLTPPAPPQIIRLPTDVQPRTSLPGTTS